ncbi:hypothetical protein L1049_014487 [Liquidambar formosana]|uniref:NB-ARC domain-containing protein n=1 Tax=Liquidambar formosana TaxID=63359 RepID=A0AAP0RWL8_LIQFO
MQTELDQMQSFSKDADQIEDDDDDEDERLHSWVSVTYDSEKHYGVYRGIFIYGMDGVGNINSAKKVYHQSDSRCHFDGFAWACIYHSCESRDVWEGIPFELVSPTKELRYAALAKKLYQVQLEKKCLVILDDIWTIDKWNSLSPALPVGKARGKMVLTTRMKEVALHIDPSGFLHEPRCLIKEESWELF